LKRVIIIAFQGCDDISGYENARLIIKFGHVGIQFIDEPDDPIIYGFGPTKAVIKRYGDALGPHLEEGNAVPGNFYDDTDVFYEAIELERVRDETKFTDPRDKNRLIVYQIEHQFSDEDYTAIRNEILSWYNESVVPSTLYKLAPVTENADNCATVYQTFGIESYIDIHHGFVGTYIRSVFMQIPSGARWNP
jgi:hypothetical protein